MKQWKVMGVFVNFWLTDLSRSSSARHTSFYCIWGTRVHFLKQIHIKAVPIWQQCNQVPTHTKPPAYLPVIYMNITGLPALTKSVCLCPTLSDIWTPALPFQSTSHYPPTTLKCKVYNKKCITCLSEMKPVCYGICECNRLVQLKPIWALCWAKQQKAFMALY